MTSLKRDINQLSRGDWCRKTSFTAGRAKPARCATQLVIKSIDWIDGIMAIDRCMASHLATVDCIARSMESSNGISPARLMQSVTRVALSRLSPWLMIVNHPILPHFTTTKQAFSFRSSFYNSNTKCFFFALFGHIRRVLFRVPFNLEKIN